MTFKNWVQNLYQKLKNTFYTKGEVNTSLGTKVDKSAIDNATILPVTETTVVDTKTVTTVAGSYPGAYVKTNTLYRIDKEKEYKIVFDGNEYLLTPYLWWWNYEGYGTRTFCYFGNIGLYDSETNKSIDPVLSTLGFLITSNRYNDGYIEVFTTAAGEHTFKIVRIDRTGKKLPQYLLNGTAFNPVRYLNPSDAENIDKNFFHVNIGGGNKAASKRATIVIGFGSEANSDYAIAIGAGCVASGESSKAIGTRLTARGLNCSAEGNSTDADGNCSHAEGFQCKTLANSVGAHCEGFKSIACMYATHVEGYQNVSYCDYSHVEGRQNSGNAQCVHIEGFKNNANGNFSSTGGRENTNHGLCAQVYGRYTYGNRACHHIFGQANVIETTAGQESVAKSHYRFNGDGTTTVFTVPSDCPLGTITQVNIDDVATSAYTRSGQTITFTTAPAANTTINVISTSSSNHSRGQFIEIVGNGTDANNRSNAYTLDWAGNGRFNGGVFVNCNSDSTGGTKLAPIPECPTGEDGTFTLKCVVTNGVPAYSWIKD